MRYLDEFTNNTTSDIAVNVAYTGMLYSGVQTNIVVDPATNNNTYAVVDGTLNTSTPQSEAIGLVLAGAGSSNPPGATQFTAGNSSLKYRYVVVVPAGGTVALMQFAIQDQPTAASSVKTEAQALANLTDPHALDIMSADQKAEVLNFSIPK